MSWITILKGGVPCLECGKTYSLREYEDNKRNWTKFYDEDGMEFDICPKCSKKGGKITQPVLNIKNKERLQ